MIRLFKKGYKLTEEKHTIDGNLLSLLEEIGRKVNDEMLEDYAFYYYDCYVYGIDDWAEIRIAEDYDKIYYFSIYLRTEDLMLMRIEDNHNLLKEEDIKKMEEYINKEHANSNQEEYKKLLIKGLEEKIENLKKEIEELKN